MPVLGGLPLTALSSDDIAGGIWAMIEKGVAECIQGGRQSSRPECTLDVDG